MNQHELQAQNKRRSSNKIITFQSLTKPQGMDICEENYIPTINRSKSLCSSWDSNVGLKGGRDWLLKITIKAKSDQFDNLVCFVVVLQTSPFKETISLSMAFGRTLCTLKCFNFAPKQLCRDVQVVHYTNLGAPFTLYDSLQKIIFQKMVVKSIAVFQQIEQCPEKGMSLSTLHKGPQATLQRHLIASS